MRWYTCIPVDYSGNAGFFTRDSGLLTRGFQAIGIESQAIMLGQAKSDDEADLIRANFENLSSPEWWKSHHIDGVVLYSWALPQYNPIAKAIHDAGIFLILNQDSAGILFPLVGFKGGLHTRKTCYQIDKGAILGMCYLICWCLYRCTIGFLKLEFLRAIHLSYGSLIAAVTPMAVERYRKYLKLMRCPQISPRVVLIPHPVADYFLYSQHVKKEKRVIAVGRWDDLSQKRSQLMCRVIEILCTNEASIEFDIVGNKTTELIQWHSRMPIRQQARIHLHGFVANHRLVEMYQRSQVLLSTSAHESFHIPAAEALCCGCTVVSPKLDSLPNFEWFTSLGHGRLSESENDRSIAKSLADELEAWDRGMRDPNEISNYWSKLLHANQVARTIISLAAHPSYAP